MFDMARTRQLVEAPIDEVRLEGELDRVADLAADWFGEHLE